MMMVVLFMLRLAVVVVVMVEIAVEIVLMLIDLVRPSVSEWGVSDISNAGKQLHENPKKKLSPHFVPKVLASAASGNLACAWNLRGPTHCSSTACAAGAHAIGDALEQFKEATRILCSLVAPSPA